MGIKIKRNYTAAELEKDVLKQLENLHKRTLEMFIRLGAEFVTEARQKTPDDAYKEALSQILWSRSAPRAMLGPESPGFNDQTGNLRSSIGFMVFYNGEEQHANFEGSEAQGKAQGLQFARSIGSEFNDGWALVTVAGMEYAGWVEALGYDVITGSTLGAEPKFQKHWQRISKGIKGL